MKENNDPSDKAVEAALEYRDALAPLDDPRVEQELAAAHDPALGLDRSIQLRAVTDYLRKWAEDFRIEGERHPERAEIAQRYARIYEDAAALIEREFGRVQEAHPLDNKKGLPKKIGGPGT